MPALDRWGPWAVGLDHAERVARCRALRALTRVIAGHDGRFLEAALRDAEADDVALARAAALLHDLPTYPLRRLLSSYSAALA